MVSDLVMHDRYCRVDSKGLDGRGPVCLESSDRGIELRKGIFHEGQRLTLTGEALKWVSEELMMLLFFLFAGLGEWIEANPVIFGGFMVQLIAGAIWLAKLQWDQSQLKRGHAEMSVDVDSIAQEVKAHTSDGDKHVNHLYMGTISRRLDNIENEVKSGHEQIRQQIDKKFDALAVRMNK